MVKIFSLLALAHVVSADSGSLFASAAGVPTKMTRPDLHSTNPSKFGGSPGNVLPDKDAHEEKMDPSWSERAAELAKPLLRSESINGRTEAKSESFPSLLESWLPRTATSSAQLHDTQPANVYDPKVETVVEMFSAGKPIKMILEKDVDPDLLLEKLRQTALVEDPIAWATAFRKWELYKFHTAKKE